MSAPIFAPGDVVRVIDPKGFLSAFEKRISNRDAVVEWVGPDRIGQWQGYMKVRFLKRGGRGLEFTEIMQMRDFSKVAA